MDDVSQLLDELGSKSWRARINAVNDLKSTASGDFAQQLLKILRESHRDISRLNAAMRVLAEIDSEVIPLLHPLLEDPDPELRAYTTIILGDRRDARSVEPLLTALNDSNTNVRIAAIEAIGKLRAGQAVDALLALVDSKDIDVAFPALDALAAIGDQRVACSLWPLLHVPFLDVPAAEALAKLGGEDSLAPLIELLGSEDSPIREIAAAVYQIAQRHGVDVDELKTVVGPFRSNLSEHAIALLRSIEASTSKSRVEAAFLLDCLQDRSATETLIDLLKNPVSRDWAAEQLCRKGPSVLDTFGARFSDVGTEAQLALIEISGRLANKVAVPWLRQLVQRENSDVVAAAITALTRIGDAELYSVALQQLGHANLAVRQAAVVGLNSLGYPATSNDLKILLQNPSPLVRESAVKVAAYLGLPECIDDIFNCCTDENEVVRRSAIEHLPCLSNTRVVECLSHALHDGTPSDRAAAARAVAEIDDKISARSLIFAALADSDVWVRYFAARAVPVSGADERLNESLMQLAISDPAMQVRIAAIEGLAASGSSALPVLASLIEKDIPELTAAAFNALGQIDGAESTAILLRALESPSTESRIHAIRNLAYKKQAAITPLAQIARESDPEIFGTAVLALASTRCSEAATGLVHIASDPRKLNGCVEALIQMGDTAIDSLAQGLQESSIDVRRSIVTVLSFNRSLEAREVLEAALSDSEPAVRFAALSALNSRGAHDKKLRSTQR